MLMTLKFSILNTVAQLLFYANSLKCQACAIAHTLILYAHTTFLMHIQQNFSGKIISLVLSLLYTKIMLSLILFFIGASAERGCVRISWWSGGTVTSVSSRLAERQSTVPSFRQILITPLIYRVRCDVVLLPSVSVVGVSCV